MSQNPDKAPAAPVVNERCCDVLARALADAKRGGYIAAAVIAIDPNGQPMILFGGSGKGTMAAYFGADMLKHQLMQQASAPSSILKPGMLSS